MGPQILNDTKKMQKVSVEGSARWEKSQLGDVHTKIYLQI